MKLNNHKKSYRYSKKAGRYVPTSQKSSRQYYFQILQEIVESNFNPHSTYGKFVMKKITPILKTYKSQRTNDNISDWNRKSFEKELDSSAKKVIYKAESKQLEDGRKIARERAYKSDFLYRLFQDYEYLVPIPFVIAIFYYLEIRYAIWVSIMIYLIVTQAILSYQIKVTGKIFKLPEFQNDSPELKAIREREKNKLRKDIASYKENQKIQAIEFNNTKQNLLDTFNRLREDNWMEFVLSPTFYNSTDWKEVRNMALNNYENKCVICDATSNLAVDHIKPRSKYPELALDLDNTQILCQSCNSSKGNK